MSTVAEQLRHAREARNLTVQEVADITKIRTDHLRALEEGNFDVFSAPVYIRGFVRSYSSLLKLNVPEVMAALDAELGQTRKFAEPPPLSGERSGLVDKLMLQLSKVDWRKVVLGFGIVVAAVDVDPQKIGRDLGEQRRAERGTVPLVGRIANRLQVEHVS